MFLPRFPHKNGIFGFNRWIECTTIRKIGLKKRIWNWLLAKVKKLLDLPAKKIFCDTFRDCTFSWLKHVEIFWSACGEDHVPKISFWRASRSSSDSSQLCFLWFVCIFFGSCLSFVEEWTMDPACEEMIALSFWKSFEKIWNDDSCALWILFESAQISRS